MCIYKNIKWSMVNFFFYKDALIHDVRDKFPVSFVSLESVSRIMPDHLMYSHKTWQMGAERANADPIKFWRECGS